MKKFTSFIKENLDSKIENISHYIDKGSGSFGSNPGGVYTNPSDNSNHYVKFYPNSNQARGEVAAGKIGELMGAHNVGHRLVSHNGNIGVASKWNPNLEPIQKHDFDSMGDNDLSQLSKHFHSAVLTRDWDRVGLGYDNLMKDPSNGNISNVDAGGTFGFRAQGAPKPGEFSSDIGEYNTLRDPNINPQNAHVFSKLKDEHLKSIKPHLQALNHEKVHSIFTSVGLGDPIGHTNSLMARRDALLSKYSS